MEEVDSTSQFDKKAKPKGKANKILVGVDASREKLKETLGLEEEELAQAEQERLDRMDEEFSRYRENLKGKRGNEKALDVLGVDPSKLKAMDKLGVDLDVVAEAEQEYYDRLEQQILRKRRNSGTVDRKHAVKALDVLGHDPSKEKYMNTLGMIDEDVERVNLDKQEQIEEELEKKRNNTWIDKKKSQKALKILGVDPSRNKVSAKLGLDPEEMEWAEQEEFERTEETIRQTRDNFDSSNKKKIQKALNVLGSDPFSQKKLQRTLGEDYQVMNERSGGGQSRRMYVFFVIVAIIMCILFAAYQML